MLLLCLVRASIYILNVMGIIESRECVNESVGSKKVSPIQFRSDVRLSISLLPTGERKTTEGELER